MHGVRLYDSIANVQVGRRALHVVRPDAIFNASFHGVSLKDTTIYVWGLPVCNECAKGIIQVGINRIVMAADDVPQRWIESYYKSKRLFIESGCKFETDFRLSK